MRSRGKCNSGSGTRRAERGDETPKETLPEGPVLLFLKTEVNHGTVTKEGETPGERGIEYRRTIRTLG